MTSNASTKLARVTLALATGASAVTALLGLGWLLRPGPHHYDSPDSALLADLAGPDVATVVHTVLALLGVAAGVSALAGALGRTGVLVVGVVETVVFGAVLGSLATLATVGYLVAMAMPIVLLVVLVQVVRRYPVARWTVGVPVLIAAGIGVVLGRDTLAQIATNLGHGLADQAGRLLVVLLLILLAASWAASAVSAVAGRPGMARATAWVTRRRVLFTVIAAVCALPYPVLRLTWLTPWLAFAPVVEEIDLATRIWGLTLSSGAWLGFVLTIGLIRPWGVRFPRWMPRVAGRPVPLAAAVVPGAVVAAVMSFAALPMLYVALEQGGSEILAWLIIFPCWLWGPSLALALWGYAGHRAELEQAERTVAPVAA